ncbi:Uncharacterised protein [Legionella wadsworthii]|uniref:Uncharacterized protein n=1 Tax=Legionella wadsworthii TaxID=28088 RepID=A0A378LVA6_9GAMM|nr:hypothetical protein [Legionella wadsworthii]STY31513.1 Uncharacterised protein [Legionella wadsworthii]
MDSTNLILLNKVEAEIVIPKALRGEVQVYIIDTGTDIPRLLKIGDIEKIRRAIPRRTEINLEASSPTISNRFTRIGYLDMCILQSQYDLIFPKTLASYKSAMLSKSKYWTEFVSQVEKAATDYPIWMENCKKRGNKITQEHKKDWVKENIVRDERKAEVIKNVLTDLFNN